MLPHSREPIIISQFGLNSVAETGQLSFFFIKALYVARALSVQAPSLAPGEVSDVRAKVLRNVLQGPAFSSGCWKGGLR